MTYEWGSFDPNTVYIVEYPEQFNLLSIVEILERVAANSSEIIYSTKFVGSNKLLLDYFLHLRKHY